MTKPLEGLLVVSLEQAVAAPMAGRRLADAGARVIKLERPEGDFARGYDTLANGQSVYFIWLNRGKESVVVDLAKPEDKQLFEALIAKADVFVQNLKPGALAKLGYPVEELCARHPRLIACSISGYGDTGPYADRKAYDLLIQAESGLASVTGSAPEPARVGVSIVDVTTGLNAYEAILEALLRRAVTGRGADIRISMFDSMAELMGVPLLQGIYGAPPRRIGLSHISLAPYGVFTTRDHVPILISIQNDREWRALCTKVFEKPGVRHRSALCNVARADREPPCDRRSRRGMVRRSRRGSRNRQARRRRHRLRSRQRRPRPARPSAPAHDDHCHARRSGRSARAARAVDRRRDTGGRYGACARIAHPQGA